MSFIINRWNEPESRAAVAGALGAGSAYLTGHMSLSSLGLAVMTAAMAFIFPRVGQ